MLLHAITPPEIFFSFHGIAVHGYGVMVSAGLIAFLVVSTLFIRRYAAVEKNLEKEFDRVLVPMLFWGILGARALFVVYHLEYFLRQPLEMFALWHGGWVWHGALVAWVAVFFFSFRKKPPLGWLLADLLVPGIALGQAIGRWGNYFNQEAYGLPTTLFWGIPIDLAHRIVGFEAFQYFHPTFLYESLADGALCILFAFLLFRRLKGQAGSFGTIALWYIFLYSIVRFGIEFLRIDLVPVVWGLRMPQWVSIAFALGALILLARRRALAKKQVV